MLPLITLVFVVVFYTMVVLYFMAECVVKMYKLSYLLYDLKTNKITPAQAKREHNRIMSSSLRQLI